MQIQPYLFFNGRAEEAIDFYRTSLGAEAGLFGSGHERSVRARFAAARPSARLGR